MFYEDYCPDGLRKCKKKRIDKSRVKLKRNFIRITELLTSPCYCRIFLTLKFKGSALCKFYLRPVIDSFRQICGNKLGFLKFNVS